VAVGEPPVAANALEAVRRHMQQEAADELVGREGHGPVPGFMPGEQPVVRDGDAMRVPS